MMNPLAMPAPAPMANPPAAATSGGKPQTSIMPAKLIAASPPTAPSARPKRASFRAYCRPDATSRRYWWTKAMAIEPSPTAAATRFTGPNRTSPQAKKPGRLVSSR